MYPVGHSLPVPGLEKRRGLVTSGALVEEGKFSVDIAEQQPERPKDRTQKAGEKIVSE